MYLVKLVQIETNKEVLGNLDGQGFYPYKKVSTVVNKLYVKMKHLSSRYKSGYRYEIYRGSTLSSDGQLVQQLPIK